MDILYLVFKISPLSKRLMLACLPCLFRKILLQAITLRLFHSKFALGTTEVAIFPRESFYIPYT